MKGILYRNFITLKFELLIVACLILILPILIILPVNIYGKFSILLMLTFVFQIGLLAFPYYIFMKIDKNNSEILYLSLPVKQSTVINAHYLTGLLLIFVNMVIMILYSLAILYIKPSDVTTVFDFSGLSLIISGNLLTMALILPFGEHKRLLKIPLLIWIIIIGFIVPNTIQYLDKLYELSGFNSTFFSKYDSMIYLVASVMLFICAYIIAIRKATKSTITI